MEQYFNVDYNFVNLYLIMFSLTSLDAKSKRFYIDYCIIILMVVKVGYKLVNL